jgi:hypothetical protein
MPLCLRRLIGETGLEFRDGFRIDDLPVSTATTLFDPPHRFLATTGKVADTPDLAISGALKRENEDGLQFRIGTT